MTSANPIQALRRLDEAYSEMRPSAETDLRIQRVIQKTQPRQPRSTWGSIALAVGLATTSGILLFRTLERRASESRPVLASGLEVDTRPEKALSGALEVDVGLGATPLTEPFRLKVDELQLTSRGARFEVKLKERQVVVHEGELEIIGRDGARLRVVARERATWPKGGVAASPKPTPSPPVATPPPPPAASERRGTDGVTPVRGDTPKAPTAPAENAKTPRFEDVSELVERATELKDAADYAKAVSILRRALSKRIAPSTRQVLSFELGTLLEGPMYEPEGACAHWRAHLLEFGDGMHAAAIRKRMQRLRCDP